MKDNNVYIDLIIAACKKVTAYIADYDEARFLRESLVQSAVIMQLQVMGEVAKKLDDSVKKEIDAPWKMIIGLRNIISHDYFMLELSTIWKIAAGNVPDLEEKLHAYLSAHGTAYMPPFDDRSPILE
jgi:uncharacterized protein with HEPN domain